MTAPTEAAFDRASYVSTIVAASMQPGGPLHVQLSDLVSMAQGIAMKAAGLSSDEIEAGPHGWPEHEEDDLEDMILSEIASFMSKDAKAYLEATWPNWPRE